MACKTYYETVNDIRPYLQGETAEDIEAAIKATRDASYGDLVDVHMTEKFWATEMLNKMQPKVGVVPVTITGMVRKADGNLWYSYKYPNHDKVYERQLKEDGPLVFTAADKTEYSPANLVALFSDYDYVAEGAVNYNDRVLDFVNNPEKIEEFAQELSLLDNEASAEHKQTLMESIRTLVGPLKQYLPKIRLHLKEQGQKNGGWIDYKSAVGEAQVYMEVGPDGSHKTALEVYAHEMYHAVTAYAIDSNDAQIANTRRQIVGIKNAFLQKFSSTTLAKYLPSGNVDEARKILDYFADAKVGLHEFVAYAMTNEGVIKALQSMEVKEKEVHKNAVSKLVALVRDLFNRVLEIGEKKPVGDAYAQMQVLITRLAQANNRQLERKRNRAIEKLLGAFVAADSRLAKYLQAVAKKVENKPMPKLKSLGLMDSAVYMFKLAARSMVDSNAKKIMEYSGSAFLPLFKPENSLMTVIRDMSESDVFQDIVEKLGLISQNIDQKREMTFAAVSKVLKDGFTRKLSDKEMTLLTEVLLDTDLQVISGKEGLYELLSNDDEVKSRIKEVEEQLKAAVADADYFYYVRQADNLGYYMATGKAHQGLLLNAYNISKKLTSASRKDNDVDPAIVQMIDELATYRALSYTSMEKRTQAAELYSEEKNGVELLIAYASAHEQKARETTMSKETDRYKMVKGYVKDVYDRDVNFVMAPNSDEAMLKGLGYKKMHDMHRHPDDKNPVKMSLYVSTMNSVQSLHKTSLRYTDQTHRGTSIHESYAAANDSTASLSAKRDIAKMRLSAMDIADEMERGVERTYANDYGIVPLIGNDGSIIDFRYMMSRETKVDTLKADRRALNVMGRMYASLYDKDASAKLNEMLLKHVADDVEKNKVDSGLLGANRKEYAKVSKYSGEPELRDIWRILPEETKLANPDGIVVRRDMLHSVFGFRDMSIANSSLAKMLPESTRYGLRMAEYVWKEVVKIAKVNIVLKIPAVLVSNVISNFMYSMGNGMNPIKVLKLQMEGVRELNEFLTKSKKRIQLSSLIEAGQGNERMKREVTALANDLDTNPVKKLIDEGFYSTIVEDVSVEEFRAQSRIEKALDNKMEHLPQFVQDGVNLLFITEKTKLYKSLNMATQYSDFVARYAHYHLMKSKGVRDDIAVKTVRDAFINYNKPNSKFVEYLNQIGLLMFTKYFTRIQKAIKAEFKNNPLRSALEASLHMSVAGMPDDILDQSLISKNYSTIFHSPLENLFQFAAPSGLEALMAVYKKL